MMKSKEPTTVSCEQTFDQFVYDHRCTVDDVASLLLILGIQIPEGEEHELYRRVWNHVCKHYPSAITRSIDAAVANELRDLAERWEDLINFQSSTRVVH